MDMPTPCARCEEIVEFNHMTNIGQEFYCDDCSYVLENREESE